MKGSGGGPGLRPEFRELAGELRAVATLRSVAGLLGWDQETYMPDAAGGARAEQAGALAGLIHERATSARLGGLIERARSACTEGDGAWAAAIREAAWDYERAMRLPGSLVSELAGVTSRAQQAWRAARAASDFGAFAPHLGRVIELTREKARCYGAPAGGELYDALLESYEPGARAAALEGVFGPLRVELSGLVAELLDRGTPPGDGPLRSDAPREAQHRFGLMVIGAMGFDLRAGRLDVAAHPFCEGLAPGDTRLTTRYGSGLFADALFSTMHEAGHGLYEQGLAKLGPDGEPGPWWGTPLSEAASLGMHESQSRMWENLVGRGRAFWGWAGPRAASDLGVDGDPEAIFRAVNRVERGFIRVEADEATYNLHVMLRFDLERAMLRGDLGVNDLPGAWGAGFERLLGAVVPDDARGCLQDVHWSLGLIGYFPTYTLGNLYAAQFFEAIRARHPDLDARLARGDFSPVLEWNREHVHAHGRRYGAGELCERATGGPVSAGPLLRHLRGKLGEVYGLG